MGGEIDHDSAGVSSWNERWSGTLQPGVVYMLTMHSSSTRMARELPGGTILTQDGSTNQGVSFSAVFGAVIIGSSPASWGAFKARY